MKRTADAYFEEMYRARDPWGYETRWYEQRKYALTLAALPREHYTRAFEPGCSIAVLTAKLAERCDVVLGLELLDSVAARARTRPGLGDNVEIRTGRIPEDWPIGKLDLVVLSEVLYYLTEEDLAHVLARLDECLEVGGHVVAVHYRGATNYPLTGDRVHELLDAHAWSHHSHLRETEFVLDVYEAR
jgi:trans-aconitate methyltransferase